MTKIIINNKSDLDNIKAFDCVKLHMIMTDDNQFCDLKYGDSGYLSVRVRNKTSIRYSIYNQQI